MGGRSGKSRDPVREGDTQDEAGPSAPKRPKPTTHESGELCLDDRSLIEVAGRLGCDWPTLAVGQLSFTDPEVKIIEKDHQNDTIRQGREMLVRWKRRQSTNVEEQMTTLCTALKNSGRADIAEFLRFGVSHTQKTAESEPCLDDSFLIEVAGRLGCDWPTLAVGQLGFTDPEVKIIEKDHQNDTRRQGREMLVKWKQRRSTNVEEQMTTLCTALKNSGRADIAKFLRFGVSHTQNTAESGPDHLKICQQLLVSFYEEHAGFIPEIITSSMSPALGVDKFYVPLELYKSEQETTREDVKLSGETKSLNRPKIEPLETWEDMYDEKKVKEKMILLSGGAGFGKSTLCVTIANTWKKRKGSKVAKFDLLFFLKLNQLKTSCVIDAIFDQLLKRTDKLTKSDVKKVISDNEDKVAFLMDGLDEIPRHILQSTEGEYTINDLLKNKKLLKSCVLVTTRPDMVPYVIKGFRGYARVETKGFTVDNRDKFIKAHFPHDFTSGEALISWLESLRALQEISQSPIIARMLCLLWPNRPHPSKPLPGKLTTVYTEFAKVLVERRFSSLSDADRQQVMDAILKGLGQVAFQRLVDGERLHFSPEDFSRDESVLKDGCQMGILQTETVSSGLKSVEVVTFLHKSHLEYCAALYLKGLLDSDEQSFLQCIDKIIALGVMEVQYVLRFCCGLSEQAAAFILSRINQYDDLARLCLFESGSKHLALKLSKPNEIVCEGQENLVALHFYLASGIRLKRTNINIECNSCSDLQVLGDILRFCKNIRSMSIVCNLPCDQGNEMLWLLQKADRALLKKKLTGIKVSINPFSYYNAKCLSECISHFPDQLWTVALWGISHDDLCALVDALKVSVLHSLHVSKINLHSHVAELWPLVTSSLKELFLRDCGLGDADVEGVVSFLSVGHGLTKIDLANNAFSLDAVKTLARHFQALSKLIHVEFSSQNLDEDDVKQMLQLYLPHVFHRS